MSDSTPSGAMAPLAAAPRILFRQVAFPIAQRIVRPASVRLLDALRRSERASPSRLRRDQERRLAGLVRWAYDTTPGYRRLYDEAGVTLGDVRTLADLDRLPILRKRDLQAWRDEFLSTRIGTARHWRYQTSGSTGEPLIVVRDTRHRAHGQASWWHALDWMGVHPADSIVMIGDLPPYVDRALRARLDRWSGSWLVPKQLVDRPDAAALDAVLRRMAPRAIVSQPDSLARLARLVLDGAVRLGERPRAVSYHGAVMTDDMRDVITRAFDAPIYSRYGAVEFIPAVGYTCEHGWFHTNARHFIVEVVDGPPGVRRGAPAAHGRLLVTDLMNHVSPMIRYEVGDLAEAAPDGPCPCRRTWPRIGRIDGRDSDILRTPAGREVRQATLWQRMSRVAPNLSELVWEYQFAHAAPEIVEIRVVPRPGYSADAMRPIVEHLTAYVDGEVRFVAKVVDSIPRLPSGKRPLLVPLPKDASAGAG